MAEEETTTTEESGETSEEEIAVLDSILLSVKQYLNIFPEQTEFDNQLIISINSVFSILHQMGIGTKKPYHISSKNNLWSEFIADEERMEMVKEYVPMKVRLAFDPPSSSFVLESLKAMVSEMEWRLYILSTTVEEDEEDE